MGGWVRWLFNDAKTKRLHSESLRDQRGWTNGAQSRKGMCVSFINATTTTKLNGNPTGHATQTPATCEELTPSASLFTFTSQAAGGAVN